MILNIKTLFGTEVIFRYKDLFLQLLNNNIVDHINCSIDRECVKGLRGEFGDKYYYDNLEVMKFLLNDDRITVLDTEDLEGISLDDLKIRYNLTENYIMNIPSIEKPKDLNIPENYITISTKICYSMTEEDWNFNKDEILNILNEKEIKKCREYDIHQPFIIYNDLINNLNNYIDMTIGDSSENSSIEGVKKTLYILNKSKLNIYMSWMGIKSVTIYSSDNILGLTQPYCVYEHTKNRDRNKIWLTTSLRMFIDKLKELV